MDNFEFTQQRIQDKLKAVKARSAVPYCTREEIAEAIDIELVLTHAGFWGRPYDINRKEHRERCIDDLLDGVIGRALGRLGLLAIETREPTPSEIEKISENRVMPDWDPQPGQRIVYTKGMEQAIATDGNSPAERNGEMGTATN